MPSRRGRPAGLKINPAALTEMLTRTGQTPARLCEAANVSPSQLSEIRSGLKGASQELAERISTALGCHSPAVLFPELVSFKAQVLVFEVHETSAAVA